MFDRKVVPLVAGHPSSAVAGGVLLAALLAEAVREALLEIGSTYVTPSNNIAVSTW